MAEFVRVLRDGLTLAGTVFKAGDIVKGTNRDPRVADLLRNDGKLGKYGVVIEEVPDTEENREAAVNAATGSPSELERPGINPRDRGTANTVEARNEMPGKKTKSDSSNAKPGITRKKK